MSYQLIYTSAAHLLDTVASGYGVVASSESIPHALACKLVELSEFKEPAENGIAGPQYSYRVAECNGTLFHVLSCIQNAGADYSQRRCHIAHHLALTYDEVQILRRNAARPTPAGITLALLKASFWCSRWEGEPRFLDEEPRLSASSLPDASTQASWKAMTGHKSNARAFFTPPYDKESLVVFPHGTRSEDILLLFHESDWLSATRGWGRTYTTYGIRTDSYAETQRICVAEGHPMEERAAFTHKPVVSISPAMGLPDGQDPSTESEPLGSGVSKPAPHARPMAAETAHLPYKYIESPDEESFDAPPPHSPVFRFSLYLAALAVLAGGVYALTSAKVDDAGKAAGKMIIHQLHPGESRKLLEEMASAPYSAERVSRLLDKLESRLSSSVAAGTLGEEGQTLLECASILRHASLDSRGHAANLHRLAECAGQLQMDAAALGRLYMHEATHDRLLEDWISALTPEERFSWEKLLRECPDMADGLRQSPFLPFMQPILAPPPPQIPIPSPEEEKADGDAPAPAEAGEPAAPEKSQPLFPLPVIAGSPVPDNVRALFLKAPLHVAQADCAASPFGREALAQVYRPSAGKEKELHVEPCDGKPGAYALELWAEGEPLPHFPRVEISISKKGILRGVTCDGQPGMVRIIAPDAEGRLYSYLLIGKLDLPVIPLGESMPPDAARADISIAPADMELRPSPQKTGLFHLALKEGKKKFPWAPLHHELQLRHRVSVQLPHLAGSSRIAQAPGGSGSLPYEWKAIPVGGENSASRTWEFQVWRVHDFSRALQQAFSHAANDCCCGETPHGDPSLSLAYLYALMEEMDKPGLPKKTQDKLFSAYCRLFSDRRFSGILCQMLEEAPQICLTPEQASGSNGASHRTRRYVEKELTSPGNRAFVKQKIGETLTRAVVQAYEAERTRQAAETQGSMRFHLKHISTTVQGELLWHFSLEPAQK